MFVCSWHRVYNKCEKGVIYCFTEAEPHVIIQMRGFSQRNASHGLCIFCAQKMKDEVINGTDLRDSRV